jgi:hypothetical protein
MAGMWQSQRDMVRGLLPQAHTQLQPSIHVGIRCNVIAFQCWRGRSPRQPGRRPQGAPGAAQLPARTAAATQLSPQPASPQRPTSPCSRPHATDQTTPPGMLNARLEMDVTSPKQLPGECGTWFKVTVLHCARATARALQPTHTMCEAPNKARGVRTGEGRST